MLQDWNPFFCRQRRTCTATFGRGCRGRGPIPSGSRPARIEAKDLVPKDKATLQSYGHQATGAGPNLTYLEHVKTDPVPLW